jgi:beta-aspartyl-dipeptidase (metallo-type)
MIIIKNATVYSPEKMGKRDLLIGENKIIQISVNIDHNSFPGTEIFDADGLSVVPGLIDNHVHIAGAGGEGGPATRTPELKISMSSKAG